MNFLYRLMKKENIIARIISIVIACGLWIYVMTDQNPIVERNIEVKLEHRNLPETMVVFNAPDKVAVKVRGPRTVVNDDVERLVSAGIDLKNIVEGQQELPVHVEFSRGDIITVSPSEVSVYVDTVSEKTVPVRTRVVGSSVDDLVVGSSVITPSEVTIKGATHRLSSVSKVVAPIDITNKKEDFSVESNLVAVSDDGYDIPNMRIYPETVKVEAKMVKQMISVDVPIKVIMAGNVPEGITVTQTTVSPKVVRITAPPSILKGIEEINTKPVDVSTLTGSMSIPTELDLPEKTIPEISTVEVRFSVER